MKAVQIVKPNELRVIEMEKPTLDAHNNVLVKMTAAGICGSDVGIYHGTNAAATYPRVIGHEMVGVVVETGPTAQKVKVGDRVIIDQVVPCGHCYACRKGRPNVCGNLQVRGVHIDGGYREYMAVPDTDCYLVPDSLTDAEAVMIEPTTIAVQCCSRAQLESEDTVLIIGAGPTGVCTLLCAMLKHPERIIICEKDGQRQDFVRKHYPEVIVTGPENCRKTVMEHSRHGGADVVIEVAGTSETFRMAWECARPNAIVTIVAMYDTPQILPLPEMYGKNLTFKTGGVDGCDCDEILRLIAEGRIDTRPLITHTYPLDRIAEAYDLFENRKDGVIKVAVTPPVR